MKPNRRTVICPHCEMAFRIHTYYAPRRESAINFVLNNPNAKTSEIAEKLGVTLRQAQYYKKAAIEVREAITKVFFNMYQGLEESLI